MSKFGLALAIIVLMTGCSRQFAFSINNNTLYDPRPRNFVIVEDPGLQSCINLAMQQEGGSDPETIRILTCPYLEIVSLTGIFVLDNLRYLDLSGNQVENLDPLLRLRRLSSVNAPDNNLKDISGILDIPGLTSAVLTGNPDIPCDQLDELEEKLENSLLRPDSCRNS